VKKVREKLKAMRRLGRAPKERSRHRETMRALPTNFGQEGTLAQKNHKEKICPEKGEERWFRYELLSFLRGRKAS